MTDPSTDYEIRIVRIPACEQHDGWARVSVPLVWHCPACGERRGEVYPGLSFDGSRRLAVDCWDNPCGHVDRYAAVRLEAGVAVSLGAV